MEQARRAGKRSGGQDVVKKIPIIILAGSDGHPGELPAGVNVGTSLSGIKGADIKINGVPLVCNVVQLIRASRSFGPVHVAGPARVYRSICPDVELIVMGTHGYRGFDRMFLGSVAEAILRHCPVPVLCIPRESDAN